MRFFATGPGHGENEILLRENFDAAARAADEIAPADIQS